MKLFFILFGFIFQASQAFAFSVGLRYLVLSGGMNYSDVNNNFYSLMISNGYEGRLDINHNFGPVRVDLSGTTQSLNVSIPTNIPGPALSTYSTTLQHSGGMIRFGYSRSGFSPIILASSEAVYLIPNVASTVPFTISAQPVTMAGLGFLVIGNTRTPQMEVTGSVDIRYPVAAVDSNGTALTFKYLTEVNIEALFGKGRHWGINGVLRLSQYSDTFTYYIIDFGTGLALRF